MDILILQNSFLLASSPTTGTPQGSSTPVAITAPQSHTLLISDSYPYPYPDPSPSPSPYPDPTPNPSPSSDPTQYPDPSSDPTQYPYQTQTTYLFPYKSSAILSALNLSRSPRRFCELIDGEYGCNTL